MKPETLVALVLLRRAALAEGLISPRIAGPGESQDLGADPPVVTVGWLGSIGAKAVDLILGLKK
ncbi:hypothetical protein D3C83_257620 [compost metagenome]